MIRDLLVRDPFMNKLSFAAALLGVTLLAGCSMAPQSVESYTSAKITTPAADARTAAALISRHCAAHGLGPVRVDAQLNGPAEHQARAIAKMGSLSHGDFAGRMASLGVRGKAAENLSYGLGSVEQVIVQWQGSAGHNANLLVPEFTRIGLARADAGRPYWALVLAR
jgi:uncharacterized protein YkwD